MIYLLLLLCGSSFLSGCSIIGYHIGDAADPAYPVKLGPLVHGVSTLAPNTHVVIQKKDGTELKGNFLGTGPSADTISVGKSCLLLEGEPGIPFEDIDSVYHPAGAKWIGLAVGLVVDIAAVAVIGAHIGNNALAGW